MESIVLDQNFNEIESHDSSIKTRSIEGYLLKINNRKAKKFLRLDNRGDLIDLNSKEPNKRREYDRLQIKERLRKKLEKEKNKNKARQNA